MNNATLALDRESVKTKLETALGELVVNEETLFELAVHEDDFNGHLQGYLKKQFSDCDVDHDYNRYLTTDKIVDTPAGPLEILPDIIIHERKKPRNLLAIELKKDTSLTTANRKEDLNKLKGLKSFDLRYNYRHAVFIVLNMKSRTWTLEWVD